MSISPPVSYLKHHKPSSIHAPSFLLGCWLLQEQKLWRATPALDVFSRPYQYVCPPYSIKIADSIGKLIKLAEGDKETFLPSCFKIPVLNSDEHCSKTSGDSSVHVKQKTLMQSEDLALVSVDVFAYDRVGMIDAVLEVLVLLEQSQDSGAGGGAPPSDESEGRNVLTFSSDGTSNTSEFVVGGAAGDLADRMSCDKRTVRITSLMIGEERRKQIVTE